MTHDNESPGSRRSWREIAEEILRETDYSRVARLAAELRDAIDEQVLSKPGRRAVD
jgi:hypothetical protein